MTGARLLVPLLIHSGAGNFRPSFDDVIPLWVILAGNVLDSAHMAPFACPSKLGSFAMVTAPLLDALPLPGPVRLVLRSPL